MLKRGLKVSLLSIAAVAIGVPLSAQALTGY
jgi:hypothetical protein